MASDTGFVGKSVIVTGAGSGIGRASALRFAAEGARILVADVNEDTAIDTATQIRVAGGEAVTAIGDLSDPAVADSVASAAVSAFGGIDVLVNNAGVMDSMSAVADTPLTEWDRVLRINLHAPFLLTRAAMPSLLASGAGAIVFTASEASLRGSAAGAAYTSSKHGLLGLMRSIAVMYRDRGIRANAITPGGTATNLRVYSDPDALGPTVLARYGANIGRVATAEEQAEVIVFLASARAGNVNGAVLAVDNGWSAV
ncbi:SDR family NAD(P)-dependent oxidoreductase [Nocardia sp. NPDC055321]